MTSKLPGDARSPAEARHVSAQPADQSSIAPLRLLPRFAAWSVEAGTDEQLVLVDYQGRTRSWFMVERLEGQKDGPSTRSGRTEIGSRV